MASNPSRKTRKVGDCGILGCLRLGSRKMSPCCFSFFQGPAHPLATASMASKGNPIESKENGMPVLERGFRALCGLWLLGKDYFS